MGEALLVSTLDLDCLPFLLGWQLAAEALVGARRGRRRRAFAAEGRVGAARGAAAEAHGVHGLNGVGVGVGVRVRVDVSEVGVGVRVCLERSVRAAARELDARFARRGRVGAG